METEGIFIPFHLEYCGLYKSKLTGDRGIVLRGVDTFLLVERKTTDLVSCKRISGLDDMENINYLNSDPIISSIKNMLLSGNYIQVEYNQILDYKGRISTSRYIKQVISCICIKVLPEKITKYVKGIWGKLEDIDYYRSIGEEDSESPFDKYRTGFVCELGSILSDKIIDYFRNFSIRENIDLGNLTGMIDKDSGTKFIRLVDVYDTSLCGGKGDYSIGVKPQGDNEYHLIIRRENLGKYDPDRKFRYSKLSFDDMNFVHSIFSGKITSIIQQYKNRREIEETIEKPHGKYIEYIKREIVKAANGDIGYISDKISSTSEFVDWRNFQNEKGEIIERLKDISRTVDNIMVESNK
jgi:hypothetical protein